MIDSHFHCQEIVKKGLDLHGHLIQCFQNNDLSYGLDIGIHLDDYNERLRFLEPFPRIGMSLGLYPSYCDDFSEKLLVLEEILNTNQAEKKKKIWAVGECGIDYHWNYGTPELQHQLFLRQIEIANKFSLPIIIHNRDATQDILDTMKILQPNNSGIMHCFLGTLQEAKEFLDLGLYVSFGGSLTYKKNQYLRDVLKQLPLDKILFETDSPYLSPEPLRGKINLPGNVKYIYGVASEVISLDPEKLTEVVNNNFLELFPYHKEW